MFSAENRIDYLIIHERGSIYYRMYYIAYIITVFIKNVSVITFET